MTIDEAIKEFTDWAKDNRKEQNYWAAERNESYDEANPLSYADCEGFMRDAEARAEYHEQLAEWLMELKELRKGDIEASNDKDLLKTAVGTLENVMPKYRRLSEENQKQKEQIAEYKRLLKAAIKDIGDMSRYCLGMCCDSCPQIHTLSRGYQSCIWQHEDEALKLIGEKEGD